jgi:hypothetical protein
MPYIRNRVWRWRTFLGGRGYQEAVCGRGLGNWTGRAVDEKIWAAVMLAGPVEAAGWLGDKTV